MMETSEVTLVIGAALPLFRAGLVGLLADWPHGPVHGAASIDAAASLLADRPGVLLLDLALLGTAGPPGMHTIRIRCPAAHIVALAMGEQREDILQCLAAGAHGYIAQTATPAELIRAVETVRTGGVHVPAALVTPAGERPAPGVRAMNALTVNALTGRQQDVLRLLAEGRSTKEIARTLDLAVSTIKVHLAAVYRTFGAHNRVEALCRAGRLP